MLGNWVEFMFKPSFGRDRATSGSCNRGRGRRAEVAMECSGRGVKLCSSRGASHLQ